MKRSRWSAVVVVMSLFTTGCVSTLHQHDTAKAQLYNLKTGEVIALDIAAQGRSQSVITGSSTTKSGETFTGEFLTTGRSGTGGDIRAGYYSGGGWAIGLGLDLLNSMGRPRTGSAIVRGSKGTIIDLKYRAGGGGAEGEGSDNNGVLYRFQCCNTQVSTDE